MGDITKAGLDRGDLEKELEHTLISIRMIYKTYLLTIEDYTKEELMGDLEEYTIQLESSVLPLVNKAKDTGIPKLEELADSILDTYSWLIDAIKLRLSEI